MGIETTDLVGVGLGGTGLLGLGIWFLRKFLVSWSADKNIMALDEANNNVVVRLQKEIGRLELLVEKMQERVNDLDTRLTRLKTLVIDAQVELIDVEVEVAKCTCENMHIVREKLASLRTRMLETEI